MSDRQKTAVILGATADIGSYVAQRLYDDGWAVVGVGRSKPSTLDFDYTFIECNIGSNQSIDELRSKLQAAHICWDLFFSSVGTMQPIGPFEALDFDEFETSIAVNFTKQVRVLHTLLPLRRSGSQPSICFLAGGGTNNPFRNFSAYCVSKIALIKMVELIDDECSDINCFIIGPGFTRTKIHKETLDAGFGAGSNYERTKEFLDKGEDAGTPLERIYQNIASSIELGRSVVGGRNFSTVHDPWDNSEQIKQMISNNPSDAFRLRRVV